MSRCVQIFDWYCTVRQVTCHIWVWLVCKKAEDIVSMIWINQYSVSIVCTEVCNTSKYHPVAMLSVFMCVCAQCVSADQIRQVLLTCFFCLLSFLASLATRILSCSWKSLLSCLIRDSNGGVSVDGLEGCGGPRTETGPSGTHKKQSGPSGLSRCLWSTCTVCCTAARTGSNPSQFSFSTLSFHLDLSNKLTKYFKKNIGNRKNCPEIKGEIPSCYAQSRGCLASSVSKVIHSRLQFIRQKCVWGVLKWNHYITNKHSWKDEGERLVWKQKAWLIPANYTEWLVL